MRITLSIFGLDSTTDSLKELSDIKRFFDPDLESWSSEQMRSRMYGAGNYAPERSGQVYERTYNLGSSWSTNRKNLAEYGFKNTARYGPVVVGDNEGMGQGDLFSGRWWTARERIIDGIPALVDKMAEHLQREF